MKINPKNLPSFPDVCKTPTPAGPIPIPYPNIKSPHGEKQAKQVGEGRLAEQNIGTQQMKSILNGKLPKGAAFLNSPTPKFIQKLPQKIQKDLSAIGKSLDPMNLKPAQDKFGAVVSKMAGQVGKGDINALVQYVLRQSYLETTEDLRFYAQKVKYFNEMKKELGNEMAKAREKMTSPGETIQKLEDQLSSVGDDAQLANVDLQNVLQKQQQTLQTMSNVSKLLHDTALSTIRKLG